MIAAPPHSWQRYSTPIPDADVVPALAESVRRELYGPCFVTAQVGIEEAASLFDCTLHFFDDPAAHGSSHLASLVPTASEQHPFRIVLNPHTAKRRMRFSIFHELGHVFFYDRSARPPRRLPRGPSRAEERFCDQFSRDLLLPAAALPTDTEPSDLIALSQHYDLSLQAACIQTLARGRFQWNALLFLSMFALKDAANSEALRVRWSVTPPGVFVPDLAKYRRGPALDALAAETGCVGTASMRLGSLVGSYKQVAVPTQDGVLVAVQGPTRG